MLMQKQSCRSQLSSLIGGSVMTALILIFPQFGILQWMSMMPIFSAVYHLCENPKFTAKRAYGFGFLTVYIYYFVLYHWFIYLYPLDFAGMEPGAAAVVVAVAMLGLPILQALLGGFVFLLYRRVDRWGLFERFGVLRPLVFAALWCVFEWGSTIGWTGVPWGRLCLGQIELLPLLQSASLFGSYFVSFLILAVNGLLAYIMLYDRDKAVCSILAVTLFFGNLCWGVCAKHMDAQAQGEYVTAAVIQGNFDSREKWESGAYERTKDVYADLTRRAAEDGAELVVWPESTLTKNLRTSIDARSYLSNLARTCNVTMIVGVLCDDEQGNEYNALFYVEPNGEIRESFYAKRHLVPFGEYVPMRKVITTLIPPLAELSMLSTDVTPGEDAALFDSPWGKIGSLICFESIYEQMTLDSIRSGAELMLVASNDSWFSDSAALYQHRAQAQLRAIESGRYVLRAANTGISAVIEPDGDLVAEIEAQVRDYRVVQVRMQSQRTLYSQIGNLFIYLCMAFVVAMLIVAWFFNRIPKKPAEMRRFYGDPKKMNR